MKRTFFIVCFLVFVCQHSFCSDSLRIKVDSIFCHHLESLKKVSTHIPNVKYTEDDFDFLYMLMYFDNSMKFNVNNYSLQPMITKEDVNNINDWFKENRDRINKEKLLKLLFYIRELNHPLKYWDSQKKEFSQEIKKLEEKLDSLLQVQSFN